MRDRALPLLKEALDLAKVNFAGHQLSMVCMNGLVLLYKDSGKHDLALPLLEELLKLTTAELGPDHPHTVAVQYNLGSSYWATGQFQQAAEFFQRAAESAERGRFEHKDAGRFIGHLSKQREELKQFDQAEIWRRKWIAVLNERTGPRSLAYAAELARLGWDLVMQKKWSEAEEVVSECLEIRAHDPPADEAALASPSEQPSPPGGQGAKSTAESMPNDAAHALIHCLERLAQYQDEQGDQVEADHWREELAAEQDRQKH